MGDTAVAVNPSDERYKDIVGKKSAGPPLLIVKCQLSLTSTLILKKELEW